MHLRATAATLTSKSGINNPIPKLARALLPISQLQPSGGSTTAALDDLGESAAGFWTHPGLGDCVIHLGAIPPSGQLLLTR